MFFVPMVDTLRQRTSIYHDDHADLSGEVRGNAVLERSRFSWIWVVPTCPYCGQEHHHYGGPLDRDPYQYTGYTMPARCTITDTAIDQQTLLLPTHRYRLVPAPIRIQRRSIERHAHQQEPVYASTIDRHH